MNDFENTYLGKFCFVIYNDKFYYNGEIISVKGNIMIIDDQRIGYVSLPIDKCVVNIKGVRS
tara:strand:+ start:11 stop:196 length:186 start_codon:yes stop_codon:yes gene_type:complete